MAIPFTALQKGASQERAEATGENDWLEGPGAGCGNGTDEQGGRTGEKKGCTRGIGREGLAFLGLALQVCASLHLTM